MPLKTAFTCILIVTALRLLPAAALTPAEIQQIESDLGITLSAAEKTELAQIAKPDGLVPQWRTDAEARIEANRKADLGIRVVDLLGNPVEGADVLVELKKHAFRFSGVVQAQDLTDDSGNLSGAGSTPADWERLVKGLFNAVGTGNNFKPRLASLHQYLPGFLDWAEANALEVRGHLLIWPGSQGIAEMDTPGNVIGVDYGKHLSQGWRGSLNAIPGYESVVSYDVQGAVLAYKDSARTQADKDALKAVVDAEIGQWAGLWDVYEWDVINETINNRLLMDILGYDQMAEWFKIAEANKVNADTRLLINDYKIISASGDPGAPSFLNYTDRKNTYMSRIDQILADGGPLDRIGFQTRFNTGVPDPVTTYSRLEEWGNAYGLEMVGTEFEVVDSPTANFYPYDYTEVERAQITEETLTAYFSHPLTTGLSAWTAFSDSDEKALAYYDGTVKLNGLVWYYLHRIRYHTEEVLQTNAAGEGMVRGFKGEYEITVTHNGETSVHTYDLQGDDAIALVLEDAIPSTLIEEWNFSSDSLIGENGTNIGSFFTGGGNADVSGNDTWTLNRASGFSGNILTGLNLNASNTEILSLNFTLSSWDLSNGSSGERFLIRLRNPSDEVVGTLEIRGFDLSGTTPGTGLSGNGYDGSPSGSFLNGGILSNGRTGSSPVTVGLSLDLANETYTFWLGSPADDGSKWENRYTSYTGNIPGLSSQTIDSLSVGFPSVAPGDFVEIDRITLRAINPMLAVTRIIEQWDYTGNSLDSNNGTAMTFVPSGNNADETGGSKDDTYTVNRDRGFSGLVRTGLDISSATTDSISVFFTIASWDFSRSGNNGYWVIRLREADNTDVGQLRFMADGSGGTKLVLDGEYGQITDSGGTQRGQATGGLVSAGQAGSRPVTVSLTLDLVNEAYALQSTAWESQDTTQSTGSIAGLSNAVIDNFSWGWWEVNDTPATAAPDGDFVELDQILITTSSTLASVQIAITDVQLSGSDMVINFNGTPGTTWTVKGSSTLGSFTDVSGSATIVEGPSGIYNATVPVPSYPFFVQLEGP